MADINLQDRYRCPQCGLSDRVVRATVSDRVSPPVLHLGDPQVYEGPWGCFSIGFVIVSVVAFLFFSFVFVGNLSIPNGNPWEGPGQFFLVTLALVVIAVFVTIHHVQKANTTQAEVTRYNAELQIQNEATQKRYQQDQDVYENKLYYCGRDDVVFILGRTDTCIPASQIEHLYGV